MITKFKLFEKNKDFIENVHKFNIKVDSEIQLFADRLDRYCEINDLNLYHHHIYDDDDFIYFEIVDKHYNNLFNFHIKRFNNKHMLDNLFEKLSEQDLDEKIYDILIFLKEKYPEKYQDYLKKKEIKRFKI